MVVVVVTAGVGVGILYSDPVEIRMYECLFAVFVCQFVCICLKIHTTTTTKTTFINNIYCSD